MASVMDPTAQSVVTASRDRVVLIAYHFPPDPAVGALRAAKVARMLRAAGYGVDVITARLPGEAEIRPTDDSDLVIHTVAPMPMPRDLFSRFKARLRAARGSQKASEMAAATWTAPTQVPLWRRFLFSLLWLPDDRQGFIVPAWRKARACVRAGARLVYTTAPPYSPHLAGLALKLSGGVRWVMELRDPWSDNDQKPWWVRTRLTDALDARLERWCLRRADLVVAVSEGIERRLSGRMPVRGQGRLLVARNGIEHLTGPTRPPRLPGPMCIAYTGTFYYSRDPRPFLRGFEATCRKHSLGPDQVQVDFVGACRTIGSVSVEREIETLGLSDIVHIKDWLPQAAVKDLVDKADVLLLLAQQQPDQVPNKLYEYLGTRRPILAFADTDGETARMLRRVGGHHVLTGDDEAEVQQALEALLVPSLDTPWQRPDEAVLTEWTTEAQMKKLLAAVRG
jgi:hypothetical protein